MRLFKSTKGAAAVEFALIGPVFLLLLMGIIEFSRALWTRTVMQFAVEEATRLAIAETDATSQDITQRAVTQMSGVDPASVTVTTTIDGTSVTVVATTEFQFLGSALLPFGPITLSSTSRAPR